MILIMRHAPINTMPCPVIDQHDADGCALRSCGRPLNEPCPCEQPSQDPQ